MIEEVKKEIQRQLQESKERLSHIKAKGWVAPNEEQLIVHLKGLLSFINTLEVKEVDLHLAYHDFLESRKRTGYMLYEVAEHFFKLGLQSTLTEEDMKLIWTIGCNLPEMKGEGFYKELLKRFKAQKGE